MNKLTNKYTENAFQGEFSGDCEEYYDFWREKFSLDEVNDYSERVMNEIQVMNEGSYDIAEEDIREYLKEVNRKFYASLHENEFSYMCI